MTKRLLKDLVLYAPSQLLPALTAFITTPVLTHLFAPAEYGLWALALSVTGFLLAAAVSGYGSAALRFHPAYKARLELDVFFAVLTVSAGTVVIVIGAFSIVAAFLLRTALPTRIVPLLPLVVALFLAQAVVTVFMAALRAEGRSGAYTFFQLSVNYGGLGIGLLLVTWWHFRVNGLLWGALLAAVVLCPLLVRLAIRGVGLHVGRFRLRDAVAMWEYAWPTTLGNVAMWALRLSDLFIISWYWPARDVGLYSVSYNISAKSIELLVALFLLGVSPLVYSTWEREGRPATERSITMITRVYLIVCLPAALGLTVLALPFVALLTAPAYREGAKIVGFVVFSSFGWGLANIAMLGLAIGKRALRLGANQVVAAAIHIGLQLALVPRFGYVAAAMSTLVGYAVLVALNAIASRRYLRWRFPFATLRNVSAASTVMGVVAWSIYGNRSATAGVSPAFLLLSMAAAIPAYAACLWLLGEVRESEKSAVTQLLARVTSR